MIKSYKLSKEQSPGYNDFLIIALILSLAFIRVNILLNEYQNSYQKTVIAEQIITIEIPCNF
jgi:hypothetical protein